MMRDIDKEFKSRVVTLMNSGRFWHNRYEEYRDSMPATAKKCAAKSAEDYRRARKLMGLNA